MGDALVFDSRLLHASTGVGAFARTQFQTRVFDARSDARIMNVHGPFDGVPYGLHLSAAGGKFFPQIHPRALREERAAKERWERHTLGNWAAYLSEMRAVAKDWARLQEEVPEGEGGVPGLNRATFDACGGKCFPRWD